MRRLALSSILAVAMVFGLVNVDLSNLFVSPMETVSIGPDAAEARRGGRGGGFRSSPSRSYRAPSRPRRAARRARPRRPAPKPVAPKATPPKAAPAKPGTTTAKPAPTRTDSATSAARRTQSQVKRAGAKPKATIASTSGKPIKVAGTPAAKSVRSMSADRYNTRSSRRDSQFSSIPATQRTVYVERYGGGFFGDPFSGLFMGYLLGQSLSHQAMFHHHHWNSYSAQRQQALLAENAALKAEMARMAATPRDPNFVPNGVDPDLIYSDEFVNAAYNPAPAPVQKKSVFWPVFGSILLLSALGFGTYFVFFRRTEESI